MRSFHFDAALLPEGWARDVTIAVSDGRVASIASGPMPAGAERVAGIAIPGMTNAHSHAFQRAFAGLAERRASGGDSFWTWRDAMYGVAARLTPPQVQAIAAQLYAEMLAAGYTRVVEFHYLHHAPDGAPYAPPDAMAQAIIDAARTAGIGLTLVPVLYQTSGFGGTPPSDGQRRFVSRVDTLFGLIDGLRADAPDITIGLALHSLRAVPPEALREALARAGDGPVHIHVAEQTGEVDGCLAWSGKRPVEWLLDAAPVDARWCLVHATHVTTDEIAGIAASGAVVALCPSTEGNLGDGLFPLSRHLDAGGRIAIGSDSHVSVDPFEELRWLDYGQRLVERRRGLAASAAEPHPGARLFGAAIAGGAQAAGEPVAGLAVGGRADLIVVDPDHPALAVTPGDALLDTLVYHAGARRALRRVMASGAWVVEDGAHHRATAIGEAFHRHVAPLRAELAGGA